jgi:DNA-binding NarL/FixJ family response regulator
MRQIIYFNSLNETGSFSSLENSQIETLTNSSFVQVDTWSKLINAMCDHEMADSITLILFDKSVLSLPGTTTNEIVSAMTTMSTVIGKRKVTLGIIVHNKCETAFVQNLKKSNINGIVPSFKEFGDADFFDSLNGLLNGHSSWPECCIIPKVKASVRDSVDYGIRLTARQTEIMHLVASRGLSNKKIAQILNISESTVKVHISSILKAYGVRNRTQLALAAGSSGRL